MKTSSRNTLTQTDDRTKFVCEDAGEVTVQVGTFCSCMRMTLQISGYQAAVERARKLQSMHTT